RRKAKEYSRTVALLLFLAVQREKMEERMERKIKKGLQVLMAELIMNIPSNTLALLKKKCILLL
ncbi:hypothetical protein V6M80_05745, partial [Enterococcus faecium]|uniref:hypothetical protein n=1 Tax=Enterococcus faecium TaxID=1352 RepID=UPI002FF054CA